MRLIVGISGSSGAIYGIRTVQALARFDDIETHLVISDGARATIEYETPYEIDEVEAMADITYDVRALGSAIASGTFLTDGMVVAPCSIRTLSSIANCACDNLLARAADVCLKERRKLVLVVRETPLHLGHLDLMRDVSAAGAVILPPVPGFYTRPQTIDDIVDHTVTKVCDQFGVDVGLIDRWTGLGENS